MVNKFKIAILTAFEKGISFVLSIGKKKKKVGTAQHTTMHGIILAAQILFMDEWNEINERNSKKLIILRMIRQH